MAGWGLFMKGRPDHSTRLLGQRAGLGEENLPGLRVSPPHTWHLGMSLSSSGGPGLRPKEESALQLRPGCLRAKVCPSNVPDLSCPSSLPGRLSSSSQEEMQALARPVLRLLPEQSAFPGTERGLPPSAHTQACGTPCPQQHLAGLLGISLPPTPVSTLLSMWFSYLPACLLVPQGGQLRGHRSLGLGSPRRLWSCK